MAFPNAAARAAIAPPPPRPTDRLPARVRAKLTRLHQDAQDASDNMSNLTRKLNAEIARSSMSEEAGRDPVNVEALERARDRQRKAHEAFVLWRTLQNRINQFMGAGLVGQVCREYEPPKKARVRVDAKPAKDQVATIRKNIESIKYEIEAAKRAPLPRKDREQRARSYLQALVEESRPMLTVAKTGEVNIGMGRGPQRLPPELSNLRLVLGAAISLVGVEAAIASMLPTIEELPGAMTVSQRNARIDELRAQMLELEREEEMIIDAAQADGQTILRRPDVNIAALLGVEVR
ncbi:hypothetical protein [Pseudorhodoplanes sp.]|uniref:hypothetical protein n=1 Tax=Pseudorhodoplanes sp. TaxID=1934341 RepID=UPI003D0EE5F6